MSTDGVRRWRFVFIVVWAEYICIWAAMKEGVPAENGGYGGMAFSRIGFWS